MTSAKPEPLVANRAKLEAYVREPVNRDALTFSPWGSRIVVMREKPPERTSGGIIIPNSAQDLPAIGWIISIGPLVDDDHYWGTLPRQYLVGCKVLFGMYAGSVLMVGDADDFKDPFRSRYAVMDIDSVWGLVGEPPEEPLL